MKPQEIVRLYDDAYAAEYEQKFLHDPLMRTDTESELRLLEEFLTPGVSWLDVACGTGFFLRHFPYVRRAGIDLSPAMLRLARQGNPDITLLEHDFLQPIPEWDSQWELVSCMWYAYGFAETIANLDRLIENLWSWTAMTGMCFMPLADPRLMTGVNLPYQAPYPVGRVMITGIMWSYIEDDVGAAHAHLLAPNIEFMVELFQQYFEQVDIVRYPPAFEGWQGRPALIAKGKRRLPNKMPAAGPWAESHNESDNKSQNESISSVEVSSEERVCGSGLDAQILALTGLLPISETRPDDIFIVSYPRSGNTWMQNIMISLTYGIDLEFASGQLIQELILDVHEKKYYKRLAKRCVFKSHALPEPSYKNVIYLVRDGRDAMASYYHFLRTRHGELVNFEQMVKDGTWLFPCKWHEHIEAWLGAQRDKNFMLIRYEDLMNDCVPQLRKVCEFAKIDYDDELLARIANANSFTKMREKEVRFCQEIDYRPKDENAFFIRRGAVGSFKDEMPPDILEAFVRQSRPWLEKLGYQC